MRWNAPPPTSKTCRTKKDYNTMQLTEAMLHDLPHDLTPHERDILRSYRQGAHDAGLGYFFPPKREDSREYAAYLTGWEMGAGDAVPA